MYCPRVAFATLIAITASFPFGVAVAQQDHPLLSPSKDRNEFVEAAISSCKVKSGESALGIKLLGDTGIDNYCKCYSEKMADAITTDGLIYLIKHNSSSDTLSKAFSKTVDEISNACMASNMK
jgi:hypothetical protein